MSCRFDALREHTPSECPLCNPTGWMWTPDDELAADDAARSRARREEWDR